MSTPLDALAAAVDTARALWPAGETLDGTEAARLVAVNDALGRIRRLTEAAAVKVAAEISRQSRPELGADSLAKQQGFRNAQTLLAATLGTTTGEAVRLVKVGDATAPRVLLTGEKAPAKYPHVAAAVEAGRLTAAAAGAIIGLLDRVALRAGAAQCDDAEQALVAQAAGKISLEDLNRILVRAEAHLDPGGVAPREEELRAKRSLRISQDPSGMIRLTGLFDPEHGSPVKTLIDAIVTTELAAQRDRGEQSTGEGPEPVLRSIPMMQADALTTICAHFTGCDQKDTPLPGATVIVRLTLADLQNETGHATIDGIHAPVSIGTARRMAADAGIIPCVLGGDSEILDWGRRKRLFTPAQRLALTERDGGCIGCGAPPGHTKAHHLKWWARDNGPTDLSNGVLVCTSCHHRIHDHGWNIHIEGPGTTARVWLIPPPWIDPTQTPQPAGRRKYDYVP